MVAVFGGVAEMGPSFAELLSTVSLVVFQRLGNDRHQPDLVISYYELVLAFTVCATESTLSSPLFTTIFELACGCLQLPEDRPVAVLCQLLAWSAKKAVSGSEQERSIIGGVLASHGQIMVRGILFGLAYSFRLEFAPRTADIFGPLLAAPYGPELLKWIQGKSHSRPHLNHITVISESNASTESLSAGDFPVGTDVLSNEVAKLEFLSL